MLEYCYLTFIAPLEAGMRLVLDAGYAWTDSWGLGLILMSLCVNIVLLPLYHLAETWQEAERRVQRSMATKLAEIRAVYRGQERYAMMRTLYRQHQYHPIYAVRTSFGFLIQVPFFFAAWHFLNDYAPLHGIGFGPLEDLARPDRLLALGGLALNILPVAMTVINLLSALVYTHRLSRRDKIQLYGMAGLFLVLLYNAASGLVFYWTWNNIFSLLKNIVYERFKILDHGLVPARQKQNIRQTAALNPVPCRALSPNGQCLPWILTVLMMGLVPMMLHFPIAATKVRFSYAWFEQLFSSITMLGLTLVCAGYAVKRWKQRPHFPWEKATGVAVLLAIQWIWPAAGPGLVGGTRAALPVMIPALLILALSMYPAWRQTLLRHEEEFRGLGMTALTWLLILVCWYTPIHLFVSDPGFFNGKFVPVAVISTWVCMALILVFLWIQKWARPFSLLLALILSLAAIIGALYTFIFTNDYGMLSAGLFMNPDEITDSSNMYIDYIIFSFVLVYFIVLIRKKRLAMLRTIFQAGIVVTILASIALYATGELPESQAPELETDFPSYHTKLFGHSRDGVNVVVFMLDMFAGGHLKKILSDYPELQTDLDGFIWYPDTVAVGWNTAFSIPSLICGSNITPEKHMQHSPHEMPIRQRIHREYANFFDSLAHRNFSISIVEKEWLDPTLLHQQIPMDILALKGLPAIYVKKWKQGKEFIQPKEASLFPIMVGAFNATPWNLRKYLYQNGNWCDTLLGANYAHSLKNFAELDGFKDWCNADAKGNTYKFIANELTHLPWQMDIHTGLPTLNDPYPKTKDHLQTVNNIIPEHYYCEVLALKALVKYFNWLKKENIYDNTQIIITSDHESYDNIWLKLRNKNSTKSSRKRPQSLLLIKNRKNHGTVQTCPDLMTSADVRQLIEKDLAGLDWQGAEPWKNPRRERWHAYGIWKRVPSETNFRVEALWKITGTMFKTENWERVK